MTIWVCAFPNCDCGDRPCETMRQKIIDALEEAEAEPAPSATPNDETANGDHPGLR
jgi:hypothetical protein